MLMRELIDYLFQEVDAGRLRGTDKVPVQLIQMIDAGHIDVAEYLAGKYDIQRGDDADGQKEADAVQGVDKGTSQAG